MAAGIGGGIGLLCHRDSDSAVRNRVEP
jgi:hypothetical protein